MIGIVVPKNFECLNNRIGTITVTIIIAVEIDKWIRRR